MIKLKITALCAAFIVFTTSSTCAQEESVILYNSQPIKVELTQTGKILSFIGLVPGYMEGYDIQTNPIEVAPDVIAEPILKPSIKNAGYAVVSIERVELKYKPNFATLNQSVINKLNKVAAKLKADSHAKILLTAHTLSKNKNKLTTNRIASAIAYLGIKGIHADRIQSDVQKSENLIDVIAVNYLN